MARDPVCGMSVDEHEGLSLEKEKTLHYFCSEHCLRKFAKANSISDEVVRSCLPCRKTIWYKDKIFIVVAVLCVLCVLSYHLPVLGPFRKSLFMYIQRIWWAVLLGLALGGIIDHYIPREYVSHILSKSRKRTIFYSVILGFFMSACSHGILALSMELHKKGASNPAVIAFLLASPWANLPLTIMLVAFFGIKALFIIFAAILIAVVTGLSYQFLELRGLIEVNKNIVNTKRGFSVITDLKSRFSSYQISLSQLAKDIKGVYAGTISLANMVLWWILIGVALASLASAYVPRDIFRGYMGPNISGVFVVLIAATIIEVCSEGTAPLAFEIYKQTMAFGNAFVFLMAGVVTDYTEIGLLYSNVGKKVAIWLPVIAVPQVIVFGILANMVF